MQAVVGWRTSVRRRRASCPGTGNPPLEDNHLRYLLTLTGLEAKAQLAREIAKG